MRRFAGSCRFVFNKALALQKEFYAADNKTKFSYARLANLLPAWKKETPWLADAPSQPLQQSLKHLERAYKNFFEKRADFPRFKKKGMGDSFRYPQGFKIDAGDSRIFLPKLGWLRYRNSRDILGTPKNVTVSRIGEKWFVSIQTERTVNPPIPHGPAIGIDVGIARFATWVTKDQASYHSGFVEPLNTFRKHEERLAKYQRRMSRKVKFSKNWKKAKTKVQKLHLRIAHVRRDFLHQCSAQIGKNHAIVCIEDLQVKNMSRSAKGTLDTPGKKVKQKSGLNKSILDQSWSEFRRQLEYKTVWQGGLLISVPPRNTSRTCPCCHHTSPDNRKTQAKFLCVQCGYENHADVVGAINILEKGLKTLEGQDTADASAGRNKAADGCSAARIACQVNGAVMPSAAGTHRSVQEGPFPCAA